MIWDNTYTKFFFDKCLKAADLRLKLSIEVRRYRKILQYINWIKANMHFIYWIGNKNGPEAQRLYEECFPTLFFKLNHSLYVFASYSNITFGVLKHFYDLIPTIHSMIKVFRSDVHNHLYMCFCSCFMKHTVY